MKTLLAQIAVTTTAGTILSLGAMNAAQAASFNFSYTLENGDILSGMLEGEVQSDGDTVFVSEILMPLFNGVPSPELPFVESFIEVITGIPGTPTVSFSGSVMDIIACDSPACFDGFVLDSNGVFTGVPIYSGGVSYGNRAEPYNPAQWKLAAKTPEPASLLGLLAVGALGAAAKVKSAKKQEAE
ncbi:MAG: PEP-CTERM sorting domain-containing protein [Cyanobacteriota bacterium]|nr:PEP-CTERM sorting domain-containing protein [Cyanobacteriota bacterium]